MTTGDGQTLYLKKIARSPTDQGRQRDPGSPNEKAIASEQSQLPWVVKTRIKLPVHSMAQARAFYDGAAGLKFARETSEYVSFAELITLVRADYEASLLERYGPKPSQSHRKGPIISIETESLDRVYENVQRTGAEVLTPITQAGKHRFFLCQDFEGNVVEFSEVSKH